MQRIYSLAVVFPVALIAWMTIASAVADDVDSPSDHYSMEDYDRVEKIDLHAHIHSEDAGFVTLSKRDRFRFVNMAVWSGDPESNHDKHRTTYWQYQADPSRTAPVCSFPVENFDDKDFVAQTIAYLDQQIAKGAVGVKVWKNIGMVLRNKEGDLVMIDDPKFDPIFQHIADQGLVLLGHLGEPKNCWLPLDEMTTLNDRSYFQKFPKYHMHLHPDLPSYEDQVAARDRMLAKNPGVTFIGCHLASLEWSTQRMAAFLDQFPNATIGVAARTGQLQYQSQRDRDAVIEFFTKYQDRIVYGTDLGVDRENTLDQYQSVRERWLRDWRYFNTEQTQTVPELSEPVQGLGLPKTVVDKLYRLNTERLFDRSWNPAAG
ncbi:Amidohydrolase [Rubripirellula lacrimiformis]|uniref:Amidohydrolase n=1 Tax=Rubripirellula lacrimiformis TaxID=1930273 RepID=A0A517N479_9BACT|nr:amidohydrolase family protein [Rubripirellula lacrimiformis]QDT01937.1 Amidohydrolase [Rubripirellula lacrimiformis]